MLGRGGTGSADTCGKLQQPDCHGIIRVDQGHHILLHTICHSKILDLGPHFLHLATRCIFLCLAFVRPLVNLCLAAIHLQYVVSSGCHTVCCVQWLPYSMLCPVDRSLIGQQPIFKKHGVCSMLMSNNRILRRG